MKDYPAPTTDIVRDALTHINPNCDRDTWAKVCMAIKSEWPDDTGRALFTDWSATASNYDETSCADTWKSCKPATAGGVSIGSLFYLAKQGGWTPPKTAPLPPAQAKALAEQNAARQAQRDAQAKQEAAEREQRQQAAADEAQNHWDYASSCISQSTAPYLVKKRVAPYGVRVAEGSLLVPLRDAAGKLWNVQSIKPNGEKRFLPGGRKSGLWHMLDAPASTDTTTTTAVVPNVVLLAEGYATAATIRAAVDLLASNGHIEHAHPVACAFDAGNLGHVAKALHEQYPHAALLVCGDDDHATKGNPGKTKAEASAQVVGGLAVLPQWPQNAPASATDFNDLQHCTDLATVAAQLLQPIKDAQALAMQATTSATNPPTAAANHGDDAAQPPATKGAQNADKQSAEKSNDRFSVNDSGVWFTALDNEGNEKKPLWVCSPLEVAALTRDAEGNGWGYLLQFDDHLGKPKQWALPARLLAGDGAEFRAVLLHMGLRIASSPAARNQLSVYIQTRHPDEYATCTDKVGWHGRAYVLPHETITPQPLPCTSGAGVGAGSADAGRVVYQSDTPMENTYRSRGTLQQWQTEIAAKCVGNSRLALAVCCAFAGALLRSARLESGGFHLRGNSSSGKTTALRVAASVWGGESFKKTWRTTDNALEAMAANHNDGLLILDELAQVDAKVAGECAYMLANEMSKGRAGRSATPRPQLTWRLLFLSAGELGLADHMAEGGKRTRAGQEVRFVDLPADAGAGLGAFEQLHGCADGAELSRNLSARSAACYGVAGRAWLQWLCDHAETAGADVRQRVKRFELEICPNNASGQVQRVASRFALLAAAGEMATAAGLTGWDKGEAEQAALTCFNAWIAARGGVGNSEVSRILRQVRGYLEQNGESAFTMWHRATDDHAPKTMYRAGVRRMLNEKGEPIKTDAEHMREFGEKVNPDRWGDVSWEYFVLPEAWRSVVCQGYDPEAVAQTLKQAGCLRHEKDRLTDSQRLPGIGKTKCYRITPAIFELDV